MNIINISKFLDMRKYRNADLFERMKEGGRVRKTERAQLHVHENIWGYSFSLAMLTDSEQYCLSWNILCM